MTLLTYFLWFDLFLEARADILKTISLLFWRKNDDLMAHRPHEFILSLTDLFCLQQFHKVCKWSAFNDWRRNFCESNEICLKKFVKWHQVILFLARFGHLKPLWGVLRGSWSQCTRAAASRSVLPGWVERFSWVCGA